MKVLMLKLSKYEIFIINKPDMKHVYSSILFRAASMDHHIDYYYWVLRCSYDIPVS